MMHTEQKVSKSKIRCNTKRTYTAQKERHHVVLTQRPYNGKDEHDLAKEIAV
jgi:hypothetical protein